MTGRQIQDAIITTKFYCLFADFNENWELELDSLSASLEFLTLFSVSLYTREPQYKYNLKKLSEIYSLVKLTLEREGCINSTEFLPSPKNKFYFYLWGKTCKISLTDPRKEPKNGVQGTRARPQRRSQKSKNPTQ